MQRESMENKLREMQSSTDIVQKKTYELLAYMMKNAKDSLDSDVPGAWELADILNIEHC